MLATASLLLYVSAASAAESMSNNSMMSDMDRYGGPTYSKSTDLPTTIAFINAGGGSAVVSAAMTGPEVLARLRIRHKTLRLCERLVS